MGWETTLYTGISFYKETYDSRDKVEIALEEVEKSIEFSEGKLKEITMITEPKKFCSEEDDPMYWLSNETSIHLEALEELYIERFKLKLLLESFDKAYDKEKKVFKSLPDEFKWNDAYIDGDFIKTEKSEEDGD